MPRSNWPRSDSRTTSAFPLFPPSVLGRSDFFDSTENLAEVIRVTEAQIHGQAFERGVRFHHQPLRSFDPQTGNFFRNATPHGNPKFPLQGTPVRTAGKNHFIDLNPLVSVFRNKTKRIGHKGVIGCQRVGRLTRNQALGGRKLNRRRRILPIHQLIKPCRSSITNEFKVQINTG